MMRILLVILLLPLSCFAEKIHLVNPVGNKTVSYEIERVATPETREKGLMYRTFMPENEGMLFVWPDYSPVKMWMKNTFMPLDMLFIRDDTVVEVAQNTTPLSKTPIGSGQLVDMVLELNAGQATKHGITAGWSLLHLPPANADLPADLPLGSVSSDQQ